MGTFAMTNEIYRDYSDSHLNFQLNIYYNRKAIVEVIFLISK
jgi:hypothetical protein